LHAAGAADTTAIEGAVLKRGLTGLGGGSGGTWLRYFLDF